MLVTRPSFVSPAFELAAQFGGPLRYPYSELTAEREHEYQLRFASRLFFLKLVKSSQAVRSVGFTHGFKLCLTLFKTYGVSNAEERAQVMASTLIFISSCSPQRWSLPKSGFNTTPAKPLLSQAHCAAATAAITDSEQKFTRASLFCEAK